MKKSLILLPIFMFVIFFVNAQKSKHDSLINVIKTADDTSKVKALTILGWSYLGNNPDLAIKYSEEGLKLAQKINYTRGIAKCYGNIGAIYNSQGNYNEALNYFLKTLKILEKSSESLNSLEANWGKKGFAACSINIGSVLCNQGNYHKALEYIERAIKSYQELEDKKGIIACYNNVAAIYYYEKDYINTLKYYKLCLTINEEIGEINEISRSYNNIGMAYNALGNNLVALEYYQKALNLFKESGSKEEISTTLVNIAVLYIDIKKYNESIIQSTKGLDIAKEIGSLFLQRAYYKNLSNAYDSIHNFQKAYEYFKLFKLINDSIYNKESTNQIAEMQTKYETEKKDKDIQLLNKDKELQKTELLKNEETIKRKNTLLFFIISGFVLVVIAVIIILNLRRSNEKVKLEKQLSDLEHKALQLQMNPHFIFNSLNSISNYIAKNETDTARLYLAMFAKLMRQVLENSRESEVALQNEINTLQYYLDLEKMQSDNKFDFNIIVDEKIDAEALTIPPMLIQPFVENSVIHGIKPKNGKGKIEIRFKLEDTFLLCEIEDDGVGRPDKTIEKPDTTHKSFATKITQERLQIINKNDEIGIKYIDLKDTSTNKTGTLVRFKLLYKKEA